MNHYANLATLAIRLIALSLVVLAVVGLFGMGFLTWQMGMMPGGRSVMAMSGQLWWTTFGIYVVIAALLYAASQPLGRLVGAGLDLRHEGTEP